MLIQIISSGVLSDTVSTQKFFRRTQAADLAVKSPRFFYPIHLQRQIDSFSHQVNFLIISMVRPLVIFLVD